MHPMFMDQCCMRGMHKGCISLHLKEKVDGGKFVLKCPIKNCRKLLTQNFLKEYLPDATYQKFEILREEDIVSKYSQEMGQQPMHRVNTNAVVSCPFPDCDFKFVPDPNMNYFRCQNLNCQREWCVQCKVSWHHSMTCEQWQKQNSQTFDFINQTKQTLRGPGQASTMGSKQPFTRVSNLSSTSSAKKPALSTTSSQRMGGTGASRVSTGAAGRGSTTSKTGYTSSRVSTAMNARSSAATGSRATGASSTYKR